MKNRNLLWGLLFIAAAVMIVLNSIGFFGDVSTTKILFTILLVCCMLSSLRPLNFFGILIPAALLLIVFQDELNLSHVSVFPILAAAILGSIGLSFLFPKHPRSFAFSGQSPNAYRETANRVSDSDVNCQVSFAGTSKYIDTTDFRRGYFKCSFGSLKVFFDRAQIITDSAEICIDNSFGETELYLPKDWNVKLELSAAFGDIREIHRVTNSGMPVVTIRGNVSFGDCKIYYI